MKPVFATSAKIASRSGSRSWHSCKPSPAIWHMIGHVQKNKAARAAALFDSIDTVDSAALAERLDRAGAGFSTEGAENKEQTETIGESGRSAPGNRLRVLIEVKLDPEPAKSGVDGKDLPRLVEAVLRLPHLDLRGLMGVPPYSR